MTTDPMPAKRHQQTRRQAQHHAQQQARRAMHAARQQAEARQRGELLPDQADQLFESAMVDLSRAVPSDPGHDCTIDDDMARTLPHVEGESTSAQGELGDTLPHEVGLEDPPSFDGTYEEVSIPDIQLDHL